MIIQICIPKLEDLDIAEDVFREEIESGNIILMLGSITHASYDTIVSAGNSFGEMNGGVDGIINTHLSSFARDGSYIQDKIKAIINLEYCGELPVGSNIIVTTQHPRHTRLIYAPTMRVATDVSNTINAYLAFRSVLVTMRNAGITHASTPLFCTGAGNMSIRQACLQMREAFTCVENMTLVGGDWQIYHNHQRMLENLR